MRTIFIITYQVSTGGGHGEGSYNETAVWHDAGAFTTKEQAQAWLDNTRHPYGIYNPEVTPIALH